MKTQHETFLIFSMKSFLHNFCPESSSSAKFCSLLKDICKCIKKDRKSWRKTIHLKATFESSFNISNAICQCKGEFFSGRAACLSNVITTYGYCVPLRNVTMTKSKNICHKTHRRFWRENISATRNVFF